MFNLFCPSFLFCELKLSVIILVLSTFLVVFLVNTIITQTLGEFLLLMGPKVFPSSEKALVVFWMLFCTLGTMNLISLVCFSYPVTTTLAFNFSVAFILWGISVILSINKPEPLSVLLPAGSPWYLVPFLGLVELVSIGVRPITLCFRLLANMSAGHILLSLICKMASGKTLGLLGVVIFMQLELVVSVVQAFVFLMLVMVYFEEATSHYLFSLWNMTLKKLE